LFGGRFVNFFVHKKYNSKNSTCFLQVTYFNIASMLNTKNSPHPNLQAPGKGLPKFELFMARLMVGWKAKRTSRDQAASIFEFEKSEILRLVRNLNPSFAGTQVLIKRLRGLEDSSRFWSIYMTLDHLTIVNHGATDLITALSNGETPKRMVSTADVKPRDSADVTTIQEFERVCNKFQETVQNIPDLITDLTWAHPWFGELNAQRWHFFTGFHMSLHRQQILSIQKQLMKSK